MLNALSPHPIRWKVMELATSAVVLNALAGFVKNYVPEKWRGEVVHGIIFVFSLAYVWYVNPNLGTGDLVQTSLVYLASAIGMYEVVWKRVMPVFSK